MVATFNPSWDKIVDSLRAAIVAAGGNPSVSQYPANWRGAVMAIDELRAAFVASGTISDHVAAPDPHSQYATDVDLSAHVGNTANPHAVTTAQIGAATAANLTAHTGNTANPHATTAAQVGADPTGTGIAAAGAAVNLHEQAGNPHSAYAQKQNNLSDLNNTGTARSNIGAAAAADLTAHTGASANVHGLPASVNVLGNRTAAGQFVQHGGGASVTTGGSSVSIFFGTASVSFPVPFSTTPRVSVAGSSGGVGMHATSISTTGFTIVGLGTAASASISSMSWIAIGS
jgi:hypothetical protein